jgi:hypothetical protein
MELAEGIPLGPEAASVLVVDAELLIVLEMLSDPVGVDAVTVDPTGMPEGSVAVDDETGAAGDVSLTALLTGLLAALLMELPEGTLLEIEVSPIVTIDPELPIVLAMVSDPVNVGTVAVDPVRFPEGRVAVGDESRLVGDEPGEAGVESPEADEANPVCVVFDSPDSDKDRLPVNSGLEVSLEDENGCDDPGATGVESTEADEVNPVCVVLDPPGELMVELWPETMPDSDVDRPPKDETGCDDPGDPLTDDDRLSVDSGLEVSPEDELGRDDPEVPMVDDDWLPVDSELELESPLEDELGSNDSEEPVAEVAIEGTGVDATVLDCTTSDALDGLIPVESITGFVALDDEEPREDELGSGVAVTDESVVVSSELGRVAEEILKGLEGIDKVTLDCVTLVSLVKPVSELAVVIILADDRGVEVKALSEIMFVTDDEVLSCVESIELVGGSPLFELSVADELDTVNETVDEVVGTPPVDTVPEEESLGGFETVDSGVPVADKPVVCTELDIVASETIGLLCVEELSFDPVLSVFVVLSLLVETIARDDPGSVSVLLKSGAPVVESKPVVSTEPVVVASEAIELCGVWEFSFWPVLSMFIVLSLLVETTGGDDIVVRVTLENGVPFVDDAVDNAPVCIAALILSDGLIEPPVA